MDKIKKIRDKLDEVGNTLYEKFGTESYTLRCKIHDLKEDIDKLSPQGGELKEVARKQREACALWVEDSSIMDCPLVIEQSHPTDEPRFHTHQFIAIDEDADSMDWKQYDKDGDVVAAGNVQYPTTTDGEKKGEA